MVQVTVKDIETNLGIFNFSEDLGIKGSIVVSNFMNKKFKLIDASFTHPEIDKYFDDYVLACMPTTEYTEENFQKIVAKLNEKISFVKNYLISNSKPKKKIS